MPCHIYFPKMADFKSVSIQWHHNWPSKSMSNCAKNFLDKFWGVLISPDTINKVKWAEISGNTAFIKMVRDGKELSTDLKETIIGLDQNGYSACKIAEFLSLNRRTVSYIIKCYRERDTVENLLRSGRKKKTNVRTDRLLLRTVKTR